MAIVAIALVVIPVAFSYHREKRERHTERLERELEQRDGFIREYLDTLYRLKDEFVLNETNERTMHALDSLGIRFAESTGALDYYRYALDINRLQERLRGRKPE